MHLFATQIKANPDLMLLIAATVMLYISSRAAADALVDHGPSAAKRSLGHWLPIAAVAMTAVFMKHSEIAIAVALATSVASLTLAAGSVTVIAPPQLPQHGRRNWGMILGAATLTFLIG